jgi:NCAIR mutase (PurE)-related protein
VNAIRGPKFGIGIQRHPHDIHDHTTSVAAKWKRHDLQDVRDTREVQSFIAAQQAHQTRQRSENVQAMHASNGEAIAAKAEQEWGSAVGPMHESESRLAKVSHPT